MKTLVIYYSRTGNTRKLGQMLANKLKADIDEIHDKKKRSGIWNWIMAGRDGLLKRKTSIEYNHGHEPKDYDMIVIGSPNWAGHIVPAVRTFMKDKSSVLKKKKLAFFCTSGSNEAKVFEDMEELSKQALHLVVNQKELDKCKKRVEEFVKNIK